MIGSEDNPYGYGDDEDEEMDKEKEENKNELKKKWLKKKLENISGATRDARKKKRTNYNPAKIIFWTKFDQNPNTICADRLTHGSASKLPGRL